MPEDRIGGDETPLKAGVGKGKMKVSYFWPIFGDQNEICFEWRESREHKHVIGIPYFRQLLWKKVITKSKQRGTDQINKRGSVTIKWDEKR